MLTKIKSISLKTAVLISVYLHTSSYVFAQANFGVVVDNVDRSITTSVPGLISTVAYIMGAFFGLSGFLLANRARTHPQQAEMSTALTRIGIGAALIALPLIINAIAGSFGNSSGTITRPTF